MKSKRTFVTNSSSCSFVIAVYDLPVPTWMDYDYIELYQRLKDRANSSNEKYGDGKVITVFGWDWEEQYNYLEDAGLVNVIEVICD